MGDDTKSHSFKGSPVLGVLSDISGVLSESSAGGDGAAIRGSVEAINKLRKVGNNNCNFGTTCTLCPHK